MRKDGFLRHWWLVIVALMAVGMPLPLLASSPATTALAAEHHTWSVTVGVQTSDGTFSGMAFTPHDIFVKRGDTIVWTVGSKEIHTVTFGNPPATDPDAASEGSEPATANPITNTFEEFEELAGAPAGGHSFNGKSYFNSGIMTTVPAASGFPKAIQHYSLTINAPVGVYTFYCLVHGPMMSQVVHVIPNGQAYPFTQSQYNEQAQAQREVIFAQGRLAYALTLKGLPSNAVFAGAKVAIGQSDVMRFIRPNTTIKVNGTVTFTNVTTDPHTVTIGSPSKLLGGGLIKSGNLNDVRRGDSVSSGVIGAAFTSVGAPTSVTFRFTQPGVYHYFCVFHDYEGMVGTITVTD